MIAFQPTKAGTVNINVSASSQSVQLYPERGEVSVRVVNDGTATVWVTFGDSTATASLTTSFPIRSGASEIFTFDNIEGTGALFVAAIAAGATGKVYFTTGRGYYH